MHACMDKVSKVDLNQQLSHLASTAIKILQITQAMLVIYIAYWYI